MSRARDAVAEARDSGALKNRDARALDGRLDQFDRALEQGDAAAARDAADRFAQTVGDLTDHEDFPADVAARLQAAADDLVDAAGALPD